MCRSLKGFIAICLMLCLSLSAVSVFAAVDDTFQAKTSAIKFRSYAAGLRVNTTSAVMNYVQEYLGSSVTFPTSITGEGATTLLSGLYFEGDVPPGAAEDGVYPTVHVKDVPVVGAFKYSSSLVVQLSWEDLEKYSVTKEGLPSEFGSGYVSAGTQGTIYYKAPLGVTNFEPFPISEIKGSHFRHNSGKVQLFLSPSKLSASELASFAYKDNDPDTKDASGLTGAKLNGYITVTSSFTERSDYTETTVQAGDKIYFDNVPVVGTIYSTTTPMLDLTGSGIRLLTGYQIDVNGETHHNPYALKNGFVNADYDVTNLYLTNSTTTNAVTASVNAQNAFTVSVEGAKLVDIMILNADGSVTTSEQYITFDTPYTGTLTEGQKLYVWETKAYAGNNMRPLCAPIQYVEPAPAE